ncbi:MAG: Gfo/Idh/MocA family oxidoreductase [Caldilineaceae bacterium]|nr:Gfo/Idh/MocA family oxidoreductase [Caldilineaceae bacterium]MDE0183292.1 Gfo/Idh/MocA family oxidoreductase [Caldilineaceae bacterium]
MNVRVGLIGFGGWTRSAYVPALQRDGRAQIISAAAPSEATQQRIRSELGTGVGVYSSAAELLTGPPIDAVFVAVTDTAHEEAIGAALDAGVHVFYEPPLANERQRIRPMVKRLLDAPQVTHADLEIGFIPAFVEAVRRVRSGILGQLRTVSVRLQCSWDANPEADLSTLNHIAPWYVDTLNRVVGGVPSRALILEGSGLPGRAQRQCQGIYDYDGVWGTVQVNLSSVVELETTVEANGDEGDLIVDLFSGALRQRTRENSEWSVEQIAESEPRAGWPGMNECVTAFLDAVAGGTPSETVPPADAPAVAQLHLIGMAAEASKESGGWADIEALSALHAE